jgi:hypothetical protein
VPVYLPDTNDLSCSEYVPVRPLKENSQRYTYASRTRRIRATHSSLAIIHLLIDSSLSELISPRNTSIPAT